MGLYQFVFQHRTQMTETWSRDSRETYETWRDTETRDRAKTIRVRHRLQVHVKTEPRPRQSQDKTRVLRLHHWWRWWPLLNVTTAF